MGRPVSSAPIGLCHPGCVFVAQSSKAGQTGAGTTVPPRDHLSRVRGTCVGHAPDTRSEVKEDIALRSAVNPKASGGCFPLWLRPQHPHGRLIGLEVITSHQSGLDPAPERLQGDCGRFHPPTQHTQSRPGDVDPVALQFLLHPVERAVFEILGADDVAQQSRTTQPLLDYRRRHRCLDRCHLFAPTAGQHRADRPTPDQPSGNEIQTLGRLYPDDTAL